MTTQLRKNWPLLLFCGILATIAGCSRQSGVNPSRTPDHTYQPDLDPADFPHGEYWTNPYFYPQDDKLYIYEGQTEDGFEHLEFSRSDSTVVIDGIRCGILVERLWVNGVLMESGESYFSQDIDGNVWALGIAVKNYGTEGTVINHHGSWLAGTDGALPGLIIPGSSEIGFTYRQEYYFNVAENQARILDIGVTVPIAFGILDNCLVIEEWSELEPDVTDHKSYAPGIGLIRDENISEGIEIQLVDIR
jgi:hypothetical protein